MDMNSQRESNGRSVLFVLIEWPGHMIPMLDMAKLFAENGANVTIVFFSNGSIDKENNTISRAKNSGLQMKFHLLHMMERSGDIISIKPSLKGLMKIFEDWKLFQDQVEDVVSKELPNCIVFDMFLPWIADVAEKFNIPSLLFNGSSMLSSCVFDSLSRYRPFENVEDNSEPFVVPGLPHQIEFTKRQIPDYYTQCTEMFQIFIEIEKSLRKTRGLLVNSFYKLESDYVDHYKNIVGVKPWLIGPVSLCNRVFSEKAVRGRKAVISEHECLKWLDSKAPKSVIYICFGSMIGFDLGQLTEIAQALESSVFSFLWVIGKSKEGSLPLECEHMMKEEKGLIIQGWVPQILILEHRCIGGFVTHCGWNSVLEGISSGVPMITWPLFAEQFTNEKLVTVVLKIGVAVGSKEWKMWGDDREIIKKEEIEKAINLVMGDGKEAKEMRKKANELGLSEAKEMRKKANELGLSAKQAMEAGGSSKIELENLLQQISQWSQP